MESPATGMWGPGDYPADFVTIEEALEDCPFLDHISMNERWRDWVVIRDNYGVSHRRVAVEAILDLAEDLDARGLVLVSEPELRDELRAAYMRGAKFETDMAAMRRSRWYEKPDADPPSSPNTGS